MHKKIYNAVKDLIENSPLRDSCEIYVQPKSGSGFWKMLIDFEHKEDLESVVPLIREVGTFNGEGLNIHRRGRILFVD